MVESPEVLTRRALLFTGVTVAAATLAGCTSRTLIGQGEDTPPRAAVAPRPAAPLAASPTAPMPPAIAPTLLTGALAALERHSRMVRYRDRVAIVDFDAPSAQPRMHVLDIESGKVTKFLVAHGAGSDPGHTGFLQRFSNRHGSNASSEGAYVTSNYYVGKHGRSQRLIGLDPTNNNALERAIVVHGAWYANPDMVPAHGKLGRSQGCFAVGERALSDVFALLGEGRMIYAARA